MTLSKGKLRLKSSIINRQSSILFGFLLLLTLLLNALATPPAQAADGRSSNLWLQDSGDEWAGWRLDGVKIAGNNLQINSDSVKHASDPYGRGGYNGGNYYNGGQYNYGEALSAYYLPPGGFNSAIVSWNATTPAGTWLAIRMRALVNGRWTKEFTMGIWASDNSTIRSHSVNGQSDNGASVDTDTLKINGVAQAYQVRVILFSTNNATPTLNRVAVSALRDSNAIPPIAADRAAWGKDIAVPERSQMIYPNGGEVWCSPTSTSMVMAYWGQQTGRKELIQEVPTVAARTYDWIYQGTGNWPFNSAYAAAYGLTGYVSRLHSLAQVEPWILAGLPVIASVVYRPGSLPGSPISSTDGHLLVIRGFDSQGNVIVNDPAADPRKGQTVRIVYQRAAFERAWLDGSDGTVYLIYPSDKTPPNSKSLGAWPEPNTLNFADSSFAGVWQAADAEIYGGKSQRGWVWGPKPNTAARQEAYEQSPDGWRLVQYFDKSRMEVTKPDSDKNAKWFVTNGLLTQELVSGRMQTGDNRFVNKQAAAIPVAGDPDSTATPTYAAFATLASTPGNEAARRAQNRVGQPVNLGLDRNGALTQPGDVPAVKIAAYNDQLGHNIPEAFWSWMNDRNRSGLDDWVFALGLPISEPYWVEVKISGKTSRVLVQLFERRVLTYNPANAAQWQVEMGNIGQHYYRWRYGN